MTQTGLGSSSTVTQRIICVSIQDVIEAPSCSSHCTQNTPQKLSPSMGPAQLVRARRPRGLNSTRRGLGWPRPRFPKMFKCSHRRYSQKSQSPRDTRPAINRSTMDRAINNAIPSTTSTTSVWTFILQGEAWGYGELRSLKFYLP